MFSAPTSVQHLEDRIQTNVECFLEGRRNFKVVAKGFSHAGVGRSPDGAVHNFLVRNGLDSEQAE